MKKLFFGCLIFALSISMSLAQQDSLTVGKARTTAGNNMVLVPVYLSHGSGFCFGQFRFTWNSSDDKIRAIGISAGELCGWQFAVDSVDSVNRYISVKGENSNQESQGKCLPFYLVFALDNPAYQIAPISSGGLVRLSGCDGLKEVDPIFVPGEIRYARFLPGDANASAQLNGVDVTYMIAVLNGRTLSVPNRSALDVNGNCEFNALDVAYLVNFFEGRGPEPIFRSCD